MEPAKTHWSELHSPYRAWSDLSLRTNLLVRRDRWRSEKERSLLLLHLQELMGLAPGEWGSSHVKKWVVRGVLEELVVLLWRVFQKEWSVLQRSLRVQLESWSVEVNAFLRILPSPENWSYSQSLQRQNLHIWRVWWEFKICGFL